MWFKTRNTPCMRLSFYAYVLQLFKINSIQFQYSHIRNKAQVHTYNLRCVRSRERYLQYESTYAHNLTYAYEGNWTLQLTYIYIYLFVYMDAHIVALIGWNIAEMNKA